MNLYKSNERTMVTIHFHTGLTVLRLRIHFSDNKLTSPWNDGQAFALPMTAAFVNYLLCFYDIDINYRRRMEMKVSIIF